jgi:hypothetical protein
MSILDDAIREHLELKRAHGADEAELKRLEDEAFGPPGRPDQPDPFAEAPTEFMTAEGAEGAPPAEEGGRRINVADLQEPPPPPPAEPAAEEPRVESAASLQPEADVAPLAPAEDPAQAAHPAEEEPSAMEHDVIAAPGAEPASEDAEPADDRQAIAEQPTELFDIEADMGSEDAPAPAAPSPSDEEIAAAELNEPKLSPADPPTEIHASRPATPAPPLEEDEEDEEFWSDQRLSEELDQALEAPITDEGALPPLTEEHEAPAPAAESPAPLFDAQEGLEGAEDEPSRPGREPNTGHEDVLEDTPEFLEDAPEDDELWFEQKPPKDFDFDD